MTTQHFQSHARSSGAAALIAGIVFGFFSGIVGSVFTAAYLMPQPSASEPVSSFLQSARMIVGLPRAGVRSIGDVDAASRSRVLFFAAKGAGKTLFERTYVPADATGAGMVLTSDGWIVTYGDALGAVGKSPGDRVAAVGGKVYPVKELVREPFTGVVFVRIDAANLPVSAFGADGDLRPGDEVFGFDAAAGLRRLDVLGMDDAPERDTAGLLRSSEHLQKALRLERNADILPGSAMVNAKGETVGIFAGQAAIGSFAVPLAAFSGQIGQVLRSRTFSRPLLGVHFLDLSRLLLRAAAETGTSGPARGAVLSGSQDGKLMAVERGSPAEKAGLRAGDIVLSVNDEEVTHKRGLADILSGYESGNTVTLSIERSSVTRKLEVTLGQSK